MLAVLIRWVLFFTPIPLIMNVLSNQSASFDFMDAWENYPLLSENVCEELPPNYLPPTGFEQIGAVPLIGFAESESLLAQYNTLHAIDLLLDSGGVHGRDFIVGKDRHWVGGIICYNLWILPNARDEVKQAGERLLEELEDHPFLDESGYSEAQTECVYWDLKNDLIDSDTRLHELLSKENLSADEEQELQELQHEYAYEAAESTYPIEFFSANRIFSQDVLDCMP